MLSIQDRTFQFSQRVLKSLRKVPRSEGARILHKQLLRSAVSIGANIIEARHASTNRQFLQYFQIALRSSRETEYWLQLYIMEHSVQQEVSTELLQENQQISKIIAAALLKGEGLMLVTFLLLTFEY